MTTDFLPWRSRAYASAALLVAVSLPAQEATRPSVDPGLPLTPARTVRFTTTEGTWMSLDVSPDGKRIVFDLLGDLYTIPISGGKALPLTSGMALNIQPRYSPDGHHVAFISDRSGSTNLWVADSDGRNARRISDLVGNSTYGPVTSPAWSPDGRTIAVAQKVGVVRATFGSGDPSLWLIALYDVVTGDMRWLSDTASERSRASLGAAFVPGGRYLYAAVDADRSKPNWYNYNWHISRIEIPTGRIFPETWGTFARTSMRPAVSKGGRYLAYAAVSGSHLGLRLRDLRTDRERWLVQEALEDPGYTGQSRDQQPGYAFTPDAKALIAGYGGKIHRIDVATGRAEVIPFSAEVKRPLGPMTTLQFDLPDTAVRTRSVMYPAISPDGNRVVFSALDRIWVMELPHDGKTVGRPYRITADSVGEFYPSWSPDGSWVAYSTWKDGDGGAIRRVRVALDAAATPFASVRISADTALYFNTTVSHDGTRVAAVRAALLPERLLIESRYTRTFESLDGTFGAPPFAPVLVWLLASGGPPHEVMSLAALSSQSAQYPIAQLYTTADSGRFQIGPRSWRWDGTDERAPLTPVSRGGSRPRDRMLGVLSPDGRRALVERNHGFFEVTLPGPTSDTTAHFDLDSARSRSLGDARGAAHYWGRALDAWVSWSRDGRRVVFGQGGALFVGEVRADTWTAFARVDVPLMVPVDVPRGTVVLRGARLITMKGKEIIPRGNLVVRDNRILALGSEGMVPIPAGARVVDVTGKTIVPGYVDTHDHRSMPRAVHAGECWQCLAMLAYGVTTGRDPQSLTTDIFAYAERERAGDLLAPRVFSTGPGYFGSYPHTETLDIARDVARPHADYFRTETFKLYYDNATDRHVRQLITTATAEAGLNTTVHQNDIETFLTSVVDGLSGVEHPTEIRIYDDVATLIARSGTTVTQTYAAGFEGSLIYMFRRHGSPLNEARMRRFTPPAARQGTCLGCTGEFGGPGKGPPEPEELFGMVSAAAQIAARGGRVAIGSHGNVPALGYHWELWLHAFGGMPNHEILRSATIVGATAIGHAKDLGSLEVGKLADLQVLDKNPLDDIHNTTSIRYVMKNGRLYQADDLTEIWPRQKPLAPIYVWNSGAGVAK